MPDACSDTSADAQPNAQPDAQADARAHAQTDAGAADRRVQSCVVLRRVRRRWLPLLWRQLRVVWRGLQRHAQCGQQHRQLPDARANSRAADPRSDASANAGAEPCSDAEADSQADTGAHARAGQSAMLCLQQRLLAVRRRNDASIDTQLPFLRLCVPGRRRVLRGGRCGAWRRVPDGGAHTSAHAGAAVDVWRA